MTELEKAASGLLYDANSDPALLEARAQTSDLCMDYNALRSSQKEEKNALLHTILGACTPDIIIAAPYWDLGFPAQLKTYIENIYVPGIVSAYNDHGQSCGLCRARSLTYITTAGGAYDPRFSFDYLTAMAKEYFGIRETRLIYAEYLDICGNDPEAILQSAIDQIERSADR